jgi:hypothetical protein
VLGCGTRLGLVLLTGCLVTGCGGTDAPDGAASARDGAGSTTAGSPSPSPTATPPEALCTHIVTYWSRRQLNDDTYGDYQSMGLSDGQYRILMDAVAAAGPAWKRGDTEAAERTIDRTVRTGCDKWYRHGGPSNGPWGH